MSNLFPTAKNSYLTGANSPTLASAGHSAEHNALETKIGIDNSTDATSLDYLLKNTSSSNPGHKHTLVQGATDVTASAAELNYVDGVTSAIQTQLDAKVPKTTTVNGHALSGNVSVTTTDLSLENVDNTSDATKNAAVATLTNKRITKRVDSQATTDTITPEISTYDVFIRTAQAHALVINNHSTSTPLDGDMMLFEILSDATPCAITYGDKYVAKAGVPLPTTTIASKNTTMLFIWRNDLSQWNLLSVGQET